MHVECAPAQPQFSPRTTWCAAAAVVVLLGALALLLLGCNQIYGLDATKILEPNYYACQVTCTSGFGVGARVQTTANGPVTASPGGSHVDPDRPAGSAGAIIEGPGSPANSNEIWWRGTCTARP